MKVLITGGAGFVGSTVASACVDDGITPVLLDSLETGRAEFVGDRIFYQGDIADSGVIDAIFAEHSDIAAVVHCAALIVVPESTSEPLRYYHANVTKSLIMIENLIRHGCRRYLLSSSAAIYRPGADFSVDEESPIDPKSPYARTKVAVEWVFEDCSRAYDIRAIALRYFNPIGADPQLRTGSHVRNPTHVLGKMLEASRSKKTFYITGTRWPTRDGSGLRDYIHVWDLAKAHVQALRRFDTILPIGAERRYEPINLGTGNGTTVYELLHAVEKVLGRSLETAMAEPRPGDNAGSFARSGRARELLHWRPVYSIEDAIQHSLDWMAVKDKMLGDT